jgi:hypothetical protein
MFNIGNGAPTLANPIETLNTVPRPTKAMIDSNGGLTGYTKNQWDQFASQLSDQVNSINQGTQLATTQIQELSSQSDQFQANGVNALNRLYDFIQNNGRGWA